MTDALSGRGENYSVTLYGRLKNLHNVRSLIVIYDACVFGDKIKKTT